jgi:hypothetical protein
MPPTRQDRHRQQRLWPLLCLAAKGAESLNNTLDRALYGGHMIAYSPFVS